MGKLHQILQPIVTHQSKGLQTPGLDLLFHSNRQQQIVWEVKLILVLFIVSTFYFACPSMSDWRKTLLQENSANKSIWILMEFCLSCWKKGKKSLHFVEVRNKGDKVAQAHSHLDVWIEQRLRLVLGTCVFVCVHGHSGSRICSYHRLWLGRLNQLPEVLLVNQEANTFTCRQVPCCFSPLLVWKEKERHSERQSET